ncbi:hypothetical protein GCM10027217_31450 [Pseudomaricurvus hydrocarbonicus]
MKQSRAKTRQQLKPGNQPAAHTVTELVGLAGTNDCYQLMMPMQVIVIGKAILAGKAIVVGETAAIAIADERKGTECLD